jgi:hypothetical protein
LITILLRLKTELWNSIKLLKQRNMMLGEPLRALKPLKLNLQDLRMKTKEVAVIILLFKDNLKGKMTIKMPFSDKETWNSPRIENYPPTTMT